MEKKIFYAEYIGSFIPKKIWEGDVHSIYSKAINLMHPSGVLISIVKGLDQMSDFGLTVRNYNLLHSSGVFSGPFQREGNYIIFSDIIIDLTEATDWSGSLYKDFSQFSMEIKKIEEYFIECAVEDGLSPVISGKNGNLYSNAAGKILLKAVATSELQGKLLLDLSSLVGLGIGFTPSGDDFLTGVMLYEEMMGNNLINRELIRIRLPGTTEGGRTLLTLAMGNSFPFYLKQFAESVLSGDVSFFTIVKRALKHGSTSGSDALAGFFWAVEKNR